MSTEVLLDWLPDLTVSNSARCSARKGLGSAMGSLHPGRSCALGESLDCERLGGVPDAQGMTVHCRPAGQHGKVRTVCHNSVTRRSHTAKVITAP
jgi:hypothetical protein